MGVLKQIPLLRNFLKVFHKIQFNFYQDLWQPLDDFGTPSGCVLNGCCKSTNAASTVLTVEPHVRSPGKVAVDFLEFRAFYLKERPFVNYFCNYFL